MSFDNKDFFEEDFIEQSKKKSIEERKIDFPEAKFGKGIRMSYIPVPPDDNNMSGIDLDLVTAVIFNTKPGNTMGYNQPFIWGSGRISARLGAVAFWAKGDLPFSGPLFEQTSISFGRTERDLLGVIVDEENRLSAYVRDAQYVRHELKSDHIWDGSIWNHVVMNWDWANGMELWINGAKIASSWGNDGWFETAPPGLFHLPAPGIVYDELYLMDRPVSQTEIKALYAKNTPPKEEVSNYHRKNYDVKRIAKYSGADRSDNLPALTPDSIFNISEVWPVEAADGHVPGWYLIDGRNEMAWPHPYALFTIIPGDGDFHAKKVDIEVPTESTINYVALTGNLTGVKVQTGARENEQSQDLFHVPSGTGFFYGSSIPEIKGAIIRIPFTEKFGTPPGFSGDLNLPLSGEKRIQNVGLYHVNKKPLHENKLLGDKFTIRFSEPQLDKRTQFAINAVTSRDERKIASASADPYVGKENIVDIGAFNRLNIMGEAYHQETGVTAVTLSLPVKTRNYEETIYFRVRDPAVPSRLWNQFALKLQGFDQGFKKLVLQIDFHDLVLTGGDRLWIDLGSADKTEIKIGDKKDPAEMFVPTIESYRAVDAYARKELLSAKAQYSKQYEFMPWQFTGREIAIEQPYSYGGPFDMIMPALAVQRVKPNHFTANYMIRMSGPDFKDGHPIDPLQTELITLTDPSGAPDWAVYMRDFNKKRWKIADWWVKRQNPDGQLGGGWNDDVLFLSFHQADLPLDGHDQARTLIDNAFKGLEHTHLFKDGYCNIFPMDRMHTGDFISERYNTVVNNLGQAYAAEREMESAWHLDKPDKTPINYYADGFKSSVNVFNWYWGNDMPQTPYISRPLSELSQEYRLYTSVLDDYYFYRMTESNVMRDDFTPYGAANMYTQMLGGKRGSRLDAHLDLAVMWPSGAGPDVARVILRADDVSLDAAIYSFHKEMKNVELRLARIDDGRYRIGLYNDPEGSGNAGSPIWTTVEDLSRFDVVTLPVPPRQSLVIKVEQLEPKNRPKKLPDLAIDPGEAVLKAGRVTATIHNLGNMDAENITVRLLDGEKIIGEKVIQNIAAPTDFIPKQSSLSFDKVPSSKTLKVVVDPENKIREILEENNSVSVK